MIIKESPQINKVRRIAAKLLIVNHEGDCLECSKIPEYKVSAVNAVRRRKKPR